MRPSAHRRRPPLPTLVTRGFAFGQARAKGSLMPPSGEALGEIEHRPHLYQYWATMGRGMIQLVSVVARASRVRPMYAGVAVTAAVTCLSMSAFGGTPVAHR